MKVIHKGKIMQRLRKVFKKRPRLAKEFVLWAAAITASFAVISLMSPIQKAIAGDSPLASRGVVFYGDTAGAGVMRARVVSSTATWAAEINGISGSASNILHVASKTAPTREEIMIGSLRVNGTLQIESCTTACDANGDFTNRWSHASVSATQDCDDAPTFGTCEQSFDLGYEALNGKAMVVYAGDGVDGGTVTDTDTVYYAEWNGSAWAPNTTPGTPGTSNDIDLPGTAGTPEWIRVIPAGDNLADDRSNRLMMLVADDNADLFAFYWDGSTWDSGTTLTTSLENRDRGRAFDGNWQGNNTFILSYAETEGTPVNDIEYDVYTVGSGWAGAAQAYTNAASTIWISSAADPTSSRILVTSNSSGDDTRAAVWRGDDATNGWTVCSQGAECPDTGIETVGGFQASSAFERFSGEGLTIKNDAGNSDDNPEYMTYTPSSTWGTATALGFDTADDAQSIKAWGNPNNDDIMIAQSDIDCDLNAQNWNGGGLDGQNTDLEASLSFYNGACTQGVPERGGGVGYGYDFAWKMYTAWQRNWRWYDGEAAAGDELSTPTSALANENTTPTAITNDGDPLRLRINYAERGRSISNTDARKKLQYASGCNPNTALETTCTWTDVDDIGGSGIWRYVDIACTTTDCADNTVVLAGVLTGTSTCVAGVGVGCGTWVMDKDSATATNMDHTAQASADTVQESEWVLDPNGATPGTTYYFRMYNVDQETPIFREQDADDCGAGSAQCTYPSLTMLNTEQLNYRWRSDDGAEDVGTSLVAQDTAYSGLVKNTNIRLRFLVNNTGGDAGNINYRLDWAARVGASCDTDETYAAVPDTATTEHFDMVTTIHYTDLTSSTNVTTGAGVITNPSGTFTAGKLVESTSNSTGNISMTTDHYAEIEFAFQANNNGTAEGNYCFRVSNAGTALTTYTLYAALQLASEGPTVDQIMRHGNWFSGGTEQDFFWAD